MPLRDRLAQAQAAPDGDNTDLVGAYLTRLVDELDREELRDLSDSQRRVRLERRLGDLLSVEGPVMTHRERGAFIKRVVDEALGLGVLEPLLADPAVTEIMVNGPHTVYVERRGVLERSPVAFSSDAQLMQTIDRIVSRANRRVDESSPMVDVRLESGERVNVIIPPLAVDGAIVTIRRFPRSFTLSELVERGSLSAEAVLLLNACVRAELNILVSGGTGTGKTTLLNALSAMIPADERIITVEDVAELSLQQPHVVRLEARPANVEGRGEISIRDLVRNSLRMRPDRIVVGEVRGGETLDMLQAMNTGHAGSLATVHANSATDALMRLETLASMSELELPVDVLRDQINSAIDIVVQLNRFPDGSRKVVEIAALTSTRREAYTTWPFLEFVNDPLVRAQPVTGQFVPAPLPTELVTRLEAAGESVPAVFVTGGQRWHP
ncbi:MAG: CpaF family protein [Propionicimonas sp.]|uniref:CpaF family protein n=1 Tax=Propionicimonas sp. TaxID=1955623 RepID=UPI002B21F690|nr:CpaF family protein [Propionicimonas sp.]MEA4943972.1 CpaF family protein [Propionicimonas sp.]MEA5052509.1 CpaF family protein [Propionicimonas sp.]